MTKLNDPNYKFSFKKYGREIKNYWKLGWQDNKARYSKSVN